MEVPYSKFEGTPAEVLALLPAAANHILGLGDKNEINGKKRFLDAMAAANVAYLESFPRATGSMEIGRLALSIHRIDFGGVSSGFQPRCPSAA